MKKISYKVNWKMGGPRAERNASKVKSLNITSLVDILTIILVFLLKNISMDVQKDTPPKDMTMPLSYVDEHELLKSGNTILIRMYNDKVLFGLENTYVGTLEQLENDTQIRNSLIALLEANAAKLKEPSILIQAERSIKCRYVTQFILITAEANFSNIFFSTIKSENRFPS